MNADTRRRLNAVNREFYETTAAGFDATRTRPWPGWSELVRHLGHLPRPLTVLDVGCGNGRLVGLLRTELGPLGYRFLGVDASAELLGRARDRHGDDPNVTLVQADFMLDDGAPRLGLAKSDAARFALVVLFGVLHHVPGRSARRNLMRELAGRVAAGGYLAFSSWRFDRLARLAGRMVPWDDPRAAALGIDPAELEPGDRLLAWGSDGTAFRYCHLVDDDELRELIAATGLETVATWRADGETGDLNDYVLLRA